MMKIYQIIAIINVILITLSFFTGRLCKNDFKYWIGKTGTINLICNLLLYLSIPVNVILLILGI